MARRWKRETVEVGSGLLSSPSPPQVTGEGLPGGGAVVPGGGGGPLAGSVNLVLWVERGHPSMRGAASLAAVEIRMN